VTKGAFIDIILEFEGRCHQLEDKYILESLNQSLPIVLQSEGTVSFYYNAAFDKVEFLLENFGFIIAQQKAARLWLQIAKELHEIEKALIAILSHPLPEVVQEACIFILSEVENTKDEIHGNSHKILGLKFNNLQSSNYATQITKSDEILSLLIGKALEWSQYVLFCYLNPVRH